MEEDNDISGALLPRLPDNQASINPPSSSPTLPLPEDILVQTLDKLAITQKLPMAERMFASLGIVFQHALEKNEIEPSVRDWNARLLQADELSGSRDIEVLRCIRGILDQMFNSHSEDLIEAANILANGARDESWRLPFGQSTILEFFLRLITLEKDENLLAPSLRLIGNAEPDVNREQAISPVYLPSLIDQVKEGRLSDIAIPVIYNICNDYERAQYAFRTRGLLPALLKALADSNFQAVPLLAHIYDLAECPDESCRTVMGLLVGPDIEPTNMLLLVNALGVFLQHDRFQRDFIENDYVNDLLQLLLPVSENPEVEEDLTLFRSATNQVLSDISATGAFANRYTIRSAFVSTLVQWLSIPREQLRICACLTLGNLARSDAVCRDMVSRLGLHENLLEILRDQSNVQTSYAALGFLRNLALPAENKPIIGSQGAVSIISDFWITDVTPQVQHASVGLLRQLLNGSIGNVRWLLESLSSDQDSPAYEKTYLSLLLLLYGRTDDVATRIEIGRTVATICRCISSSSQGFPPESTSAILHRLYGIHADIARPLAMMISQSRLPVIRSEGWFALALMARSREGSAAVSDVFQQLETFGILVSTITGQSTNGSGVPAGTIGHTRDDSGSSSGSSGNRSEQEREMAEKDRENALVLVNELLQHSVRVDFLFVSILRRFSCWR
ncbi:MAG: hypothetical protein Q9218_006210 [Villophora microphyllina]